MSKMRISFSASRRRMAKPPIRTTKRTGEDSPAKPGSHIRPYHARNATDGGTLSNRTFVIGVGMTKFDKPGTKEGDYPDWAKEAGEMALADAGVPYDEVEQAYVGYCYGESTSGQRA